MYNTLRPELFTATTEQKEKLKCNPQYVVTLDLFAQNQIAYLEFKRQFILDIADNKYKPTISHYFVQLCHDKGLLRRLYSQNIDGLHKQTGIPDEKAVFVHGDMRTIQCEYCNYDGINLEQFRNEVQSKIKDIYNVDSSGPAVSTSIPCPQCAKNGLKPAAVLFGRDVVPRYFEYEQVDFQDCDLLIIVGTSLAVGPVNRCVTRVKLDCPRLIINKEKVGENLGIAYDRPNSRDIFAGGSCDKIFLILIQKLGWFEELKSKYYFNLSQQSQQLLNEFEINKI